MPIRWDKRNKRFRFEFDRYIEGQRKRTSRLLPKGWSQSQADAYDRRESGRLYAVATGIERADALIDTAVLHYLQDKSDLKSIRQATENLAAIAWAYTGKPLSALPDVARLVNKTRQGVKDGVTLSDATVRQRLALLKAACRWAWKKHGICDNDPTARMLLPAVNNERHVYAGRREMLKIAWAADRHDTRILIRVAFYTGMRLSEILSAAPDGGMLHLEETKNGERRSVPIHPRIRAAADYLPLATSKNTLQAAFRRARKKAGLEHVRLHDLRHSAASEMVNAGVDLFTVGRVLGHKDARSTARYSHLMAETLTAAVSKIGKKSRTTTHEKGHPKAA